MNACTYQDDSWPAVAWPGWEKMYSGGRGAHAAAVYSAVRDSYPAKNCVAAQPHRPEQAHILRQPMTKACTNVCGICILIRKPVHLMMNRSPILNWQDASQRCRKHRGLVTGVAAQGAGAGGAPLGIGGASGHCTEGRVFHLLPCQCGGGDSPGAFKFPHERLFPCYLQLHSFCGGSINPLPYHLARRQEVGAIVTPLRPASMSWWRYDALCMKDVTGIR